MSCGWLCLVPLWSCSKVYMLLAYLLGYSYLGAYSSLALVLLVTLVLVMWARGVVPGLGLSLQALLLILLLFFSTEGVLVLYLLFELILLPIYLLVLAWGVCPERVVASMYLLLYTMALSLPLLLLVLLLGLPSLLFSSGWLLSW